jgi:thymidine kinase
VNKVGHLTVNVGSMFSGKSTELRRQGKRYELAGRRVLYIKPQTDDRYSETEIVTHDDERVAAMAVADGLELVGIALANMPDLVCVDEGQFFDGSLILAIDELLYTGVDVVVSGLDMDRFGRPFGIMPYLMATADKVNKFHAVCAECGDDGYMSMSKKPLDESEAVGGADKYMPLCRGCYHKRMKEGD